MKVEIVSLVVRAGVAVSEALQRTEMMPFGTAVTTNEALYSLATFVGVPGSSVETLPAASSAAILTLAGSTGFDPGVVDVVAVQTAFKVSPTSTPSDVGSDSALGLVTLTTGPPKSLPPDPPDPADPPEPPAPVAPLDPPAPPEPCVLLEVELVVAVCEPSGFTWGG